MAAGGRVLRLVFPRPGFFVTDTHLEVDFDGLRLYEGSFVSGFQAELPVAPGAHQIVTRIFAGPFARTRTYALSIGDAPSYVAVLRYSRFWGNFTRTLQFAPAAAAPPG